MKQLTWADIKRLYADGNPDAIVEVHADHLARVARLLSERFAGVIFFWMSSWSRKGCAILALRPDGKAIPREQLDKIITAGEALAREAAAKHPARAGPLRSLLGVAPGYYFKL